MEELKEEVGGKESFRRKLGKRSRLRCGNGRWTVNEENRCVQSGGKRGKRKAEIE